MSLQDGIQRERFLKTLNNEILASGQAIETVRFGRQQQQTNTLLNKANIRMKKSWKKKVSTRTLLEKHTRYQHR